MVQQCKYVVLPNSMCRLCTSNLIWILESRSRKAPGFSLQQVLHGLSICHRCSVICFVSTCANFSSSTGMGLNGSLEWSHFCAKFSTSMMASLPDHGVQKISSLDLHELLFGPFQQMASLPDLQPQEIFQPRLT